MFEGRKYFTLLVLMTAFWLSGHAEFGETSHVMAAPVAHNVDEKRFFKKVRTLMHRRGLADIQFATYKQIINYWNEHKDMGDRRWLAYVMATAYHETQLKPVREGFKKSDAAARRHVRWMWNKRIITLPYHRPDRVTGHVYYGRGYVQLTWAENYKKMGRAIGMGDKLYRNPDLVLDPEIASKVLFVGMLKGKFRYSRRTAPRGWQKLNMFFNRRSENWYRARNIINGDLRKNGNRIAGYGRKYTKAIRLLTASQTTPVEPTLPEPTPTEPTPAEPTPTPDGDAGDPELVPDEGEVVPSLPGVQEEGGASEDGADGDAPQPAEPVTPSDDPVGEIVPQLPENGNTSDEDDTDRPEPQVDEPGDIGNEPELDIVPIPISEELEEPETPIIPTHPIEPEVTPTPSSPDREAVDEQDPQAEPETNPQTGEATTGDRPTETAPSEDNTGKPQEKQGWWGSIKSFFAKYRGYVWKYQ